MINHVRTLVLNLSDAAAGLDSGIPEAEYIQPDFGPLALPPMLGAVRSVLFPDGSSAYYCISLVNRLMRLVHLPDLDGYARSMDARITYDRGVGSLPDIHPELEHAMHTDDTSISASVTYDATAPVLLPGTRATWTVSRDAAMRVDRLRVSAPGRSETELGVTFIGTRAVLPLVPSGVSVNLYSDSGNLSGTFRLDIEHRMPARVDTTGLVAALEHSRLGHIGIDRVLLPAGPRASDLTVLKMAWDSDTFPTLRLGAFLIAYAYKCEYVRTGIPI